MTKPGDMTVTMRVLIPVDDVYTLLEHLEATEDRVWLARSTSGMRHTFRGVPARRVDLVICDGWMLTTAPGAALGEPSHMVDSPACIVEVGRKSGRFDGAERVRIAVRPTNRGMVAQLAIHEGRLFVLAPESPGNVARTVRVRLDTTDVDGTPRRWQREWDRLRWEPTPGETLPGGEDVHGHLTGSSRVVMWHWSRYYQHLAESDARALAATWAWPLRDDGPVTLAEANRSASRALYLLSRSLGWRKLTLRERTRLHLDGGQWTREAVYAEAQARRQGFPADGASEYSHDEASGRVAPAIIAVQERVRSRAEAPPTPAPANADEPPHS